MYSDETIPYWGEIALISKDTHLPRSTSPWNCAEVGYGVVCAFSYMITVALFEKRYFRAQRYAPMCVIKGSFTALRTLTKYYMQIRIDWSWIIFLNFAAPHMMIKMCIRESRSRYFSRRNNRIYKLFCDCQNLVEQLSLALVLQERKQTFKRHKNNTHSVLQLTLGTSRSEDGVENVA